MQNRKPICLLLILLILFITTTSPVVAKEYNLLELYHFALSKDPTLFKAQAKLETSIADKEIAVSSLLPKISANGSVRQMWHTVYDYAPKPIDGEFTGYSYGVGGALYLLNMPTYYQIYGASTAINSAELAVKAMRQQLMGRTIDAYIKYLKAMADEKLYRDEIFRLNKILHQAEAFLKSGTGDVISLYEAKAKLQSASADLVKAEGQIRIALQNLSSIAGIEVNAVKEITITKAENPKPENIETWLDIMRQNNPALQKAKKDFEQSEYATKTAKSAHYPTIDGNGGYTVDKGSTFLPNVETQQWYVGMRMNLPLFSGGETSARTRRAMAGEAEQRANIEEALEQGIRNIKDAYLKVIYTKSLVEAYRQKLESAELQLKAVEKGNNIGTRTSIDLLNAEQSVAISRRDLSSALYDNLQLQLQLKLEAGILSEDDIMIRITTN